MLRTLFTSSVKQIQGFSLFFQCFDLLKKFFPPLFQELAPQQHQNDTVSAPVRLKNTPWQQIAINKGAIGIHFDPINQGLDTMCTVGDYTGGFLVIPSMGIVLNSTPNTLIFLKSHRHPHFVTNFQGRRFSIVAFTHQSTHQAFGQQKVDGSIQLDKFWSHLPLLELSEDILRETRLRFSK